MRPFQTSSSEGLSPLKESSTELLTERLKAPTVAEKEAARPFHMPRLKPNSAIGSPSVSRLLDFSSASIPCGEMSAGLPASFRFDAFRNQCARVVCAPAPALRNWDSLAAHSGLLSLREPQ